jgi:phosphocarrier protein
MTRVERTVTVDHDEGLHARPASVFVQTASEFDSEITVSRPDGDQTADAKSSIGVVSLGVEPGDTVAVAAEGPDARSAVDELVALVESGFAGERA